MSTFGKYDLNDPTWYQKWQKERQEAQQRQEEERKRQEAEAKKKRELEAELDLEDDDAADDVQFEDYEPLWLKGIGKKHPDPVVENASLSAVKAPKPPDDALADISPDVVKEGKLSNLQLEAVAYANMCFGKNLEDGSRRGFFIGDGAGIGKGRELAGIVAQQWARGVRKHLWISVSNDLKFDAERDLRDLGSGNIPVQLLGKASYSVACGVPFCYRGGGAAVGSRRWRPSALIDGRETPSAETHDSIHSRVDAWRGVAATAGARRHRRDALTRQHAGPRPPQAGRRLRDVRISIRKEGRQDVEAPDSTRSTARVGLAGLRGRFTVRRVAQGQEPVWGQRRQADQDGPGRPQATNGITAS